MDETVKALSLERIGLQSPVNPGLDVSQYCNHDDEAHKNATRFDNVTSSAVLAKDALFMDVVVYPNLVWNIGDRGCLRAAPPEMGEASLSTIPRNETVESIGSSGVLLSYNPPYADIPPIAGRAVFLLPECIQSEVDLSYGKTFGLLLRYRIIRERGLAPQAAKGSALHPNDLSISDYDRTEPPFSVISSSAPQQIVSSNLFPESSSSFQTSGQDCSRTPYAMPNVDTINIPQMDDLQSLREGDKDSPIGLAARLPSVDRCRGSVGTCYTELERLSWIRQHRVTMRSGASIRNPLSGYRLACARTVPLLRRFSKLSLKADVDEEKGMVRNDTAVRHVVHGSRGVRKPTKSIPAVTESDGARRDQNVAPQEVGEAKEIERNLNSITEGTEETEVCSMLRDGRLGKDLGELFTTIEQEHSKTNSLAGCVDDDGLDTVDELVKDPPDDAAALGKDIFGDNQQDLTTEEKQELEYSIDGMPEIQSRRQAVHHGRAFMDDYYKHHGYKDPGLSHGFTNNGLVYHWKETLDDIEIMAPVNKLASPRDIRFSLVETHLTLSERQDNAEFLTLLNGMVSCTFM
eukprot:GHVQ01024327.1.p1 GENE.GHVQ01024327.1~~GHVQ01024327.1.p1  ORF type:complete len:575 (+),score=57.98 GHVQ01024327.1:1455-3179(+)